MASPGSTRVTELANPFSIDIDVADPSALIRIMGASDSLMFSGWGGLPHIYADECVEAMSNAAKAIAISMYHPRGRVVFAGCGTSGRLAHLTARAMNNWMVRQFGAQYTTSPRFDYLLAGGDAALLLPQESVEDKPDAGVVDLGAWETQHRVSPTDPIVVIGISCGLSATYVGSMLHAALGRAGYTPIALGFNPIQASQGIKVDGWAGSFYATLQAMLHGPAASRCVVLNPVLGPETIAGSSRMKGGSATKMVLETVCTAGVLVSKGLLGPCVAAAAAASAALDGASSAVLSALSTIAVHSAAVDVSLRAATTTSTTLGGSAGALATQDATSALLPALIRDALLQYEVAVRSLYNAHASSMATLVALASTALTTPVPGPLLAPPHADTASGARHFVSPTGRGRIIYLGVGSGGLLALIDASECTPTYGSAFNDVRGFLAGGWATVQGKGAKATSAPVAPVAVTAGAEVTARDQASSSNGAAPHSVGGGGGDNIVLPMPAHLRGDGGSPSSSVPERIYLGLDSFITDVCPTLSSADLVCIVWVPEATVATVPAAHSNDHSATGSSPQSQNDALEAALSAAVAASSAGAVLAHAVVVGNGTADRHHRHHLARIRAVAPIGVTCVLPSLQLGWDLRCTLPPSLSAPVCAAMAPVVGASPSFLGELALKLVLNAVTTGAHIARGTIFRNRMINVAITNQKLFHRAVGIVADVTTLPLDRARRAVLRAIYAVDEDVGGGGGPPGASHTLDAMDAGHTGKHVAVAASLRQLVPIAILLGLDEVKRASAPAPGSPVASPRKSFSSSASGSPTGPMRSVRGATAASSPASAGGGGGSSSGGSGSPRKPVISGTRAGSNSGSSGNVPLSVAAATAILDAEPVIRRALLAATIPL